MPALLRNLLFYLAGTLSVASFSFYNGYPFINGDTSAYLNAAWEYTVPYERPVFYGWFLKLFSLNYTLWTSILAQSFLVFWTVAQTIIRFTSIQKKSFILFTLLITLLGTHLGWEANKLLPDVFAGLVLLLILLYLHTQTSVKWLYLFLIILLGSFHNTHFVLYFLTGTLFLIIGIWKPVFPRSKLVGILLAGVASLSVVSLSNYIDHGKLQLGRSSEVFMAGQAAESGLLYTVLCDECPSRDWKLCTYQDSLPVRGWMYVWNPNSPVAKIGGWDVLKTEHQEILKTLYFSPKYWPKLVFTSLIRGFSNCFQLDIGDGIFRCEYDTNIQQSIRKYYPGDKATAGWNKQYILTIPFNAFTVWHLIILGLLLLSVCWMWSTDKLTPMHLNLLLFALTTIYLNSWAVAQFSNISDRLNTRVFWILPFLLILILSEYLLKKKNI